jgi:Na+-transporting NADH:ubiquinone oxidoreductase subunit A
MDLVTSESARVISGSVLSGRSSQAPIDFLGRFHNQVSLLDDGSHREFLGWAMPGFNKFSVSKAFASGFFKSGSRIPFSTSAQGSKRAIVPIGMYEKVMPLDIIATPMLKSLIVQDTETALMLGCLELDEEDLALCTFVCPGKNEYGPLLRQCLTHIEREG